MLYGETVHMYDNQGGTMNAAEALASLPEAPEEGQLDFFDASVYKSSLFSVTGANKHKAPRELKPGEQVSGRFTGTVVSMDATGFASMTAEPTVCFKITADEVVLDD